MKKYICLLVAVLTITFSLAGCGNHEHSWVEANCVTPKTCPECGETRGEALGHQWLEATCAAPKTCSVCGTADGEAAGHKWLEATCAAPKTCQICKATEGEALAHTWVPATCTSSMTCTVCGVSSGSPLEHSWEEATCVAPKTCLVCGSTDGEALGHALERISCVDEMKCSRCEEVVAALGHDWIDASCTEPKTCSRCDLKEGKPNGHSESDAVEENEITATCIDDGQYEEVVYCSTCKEELSRRTITEPALGHTTKNGTCSRCGQYVVEPIVYSGSGSQVITGIEVPYGMYKVTMTNSGKSNFIVHAYTKAGERLSSFANEIGNYEGSIFLGENIDGGILEVTSKGKWSISFEIIQSGGTSNIAGTGDWVSPWFTLNGGVSIVSLTNSGMHNFIVRVYDEYGNKYSSLVNEIGNYSGSTVFNYGKAGVKYCIQVISSGTWTVDFGLGEDVTSK